MDACPQSVSVICTGGCNLNKLPPIFHFPCPFPVFLRSCANGVPAFEVSLIVAGLPSIHLRGWAVLRLTYYGRPLKGRRWRLLSEPCSWRCVAWKHCSSTRCRSFYKSFV